ncbi:MAG TPA: hypothetical protein VGF73_00420 [Chthoniobacterales bacterium]|jgi:GNAT superfamily N-acetyltransferase
MIDQLYEGAVGELEELLPRLPDPPLGHLVHLTPAQTRACWLDEIRRDLAAPSASAWIARAGADIDGLLFYIDAPWDSKVVGQKVGTLRHFAALIGSGNRDRLLETALEHASKRGVRCVTCKVQASEIDTIHSLEKHGFLLMDSLVDFIFDFSSRSADANKARLPGGGAMIRLAEPEDLVGTVLVAEKAFAHYFGRYQADPNVSADAATDFYRQWVQSSFHGWADWILVAEVERRIVGFGIWKKASELEARHLLGVAHYDLAGIDPDFAGRGLYSALAIEGMQRARPFTEHLIGPVHVRNYAVHRALSRLGWKIRAARHSFHKWL